MASTLIVEDSTGLSTADCYLSAAAADTYFTKHGAPAAWTAATEAGKDAALRFATAWLDSQFLFLGTVRVTTQALKWPRLGVWDQEGREVAEDSVPQRVKDAVCELALDHLAHPLNEALERGGEVKTETVGPISTTYHDWAPSETTRPYVRRLVRDLLTTGAGQVEVVRA